MIVAGQARNLLAALLDAMTDSDMSILFSFAPGAFYCHDDVLLSLHCVNYALSAFRVM
jgi:hypothetical protein